jgi:HSP20 family protein
MLCGCFLFVVERRANQNIIKMAIINVKNSGRGPQLSPYLSSFFDDEGFFKMPASSMRMPAVNVSENDAGYLIEMAVPGFAKGDFDIELKDGILTVSSQKSSEEQEEEKNYSMREYRYSSFSRSFSVPDNVDAESIKARYEDGILKIDLSKTEPEVPKTKSIAID